MSQGKGISLGEGGGDFTSECCAVCRGTSMGSFYELLPPGHLQPSLCPECTTVWDPPISSKQHPLVPKQFFSLWCRGGGGDAGASQGTGAAQGRAKPWGHSCKGSVGGRSGLKFIRGFPTSSFSAVNRKLRFYVTPQIFGERACFYSSFYLFVSSPHWEPECLQLMESRGGAGC